MGRQLTTKEFIKKSEEIHGDKYDYSKTIYTKTKDKVIIICKKHNFEFEQKPYGHLEGKGCRKCANNYNYNTDEWILIAKNIHSDKYDYSKVKYINTKTKVIIICKNIEHEGFEFEQLPNSHVSHKNGCPKCGGTYNYNTTEFIEKAKEIHGDKYDYSKTTYTNIRENINIICKIHGEFLQKANSHIIVKSGCPKCVNVYNYDTEEWIKKAEEIHGDKYDYSDTIYINALTKVIIRCKIHGLFEQLPKTHLNSTNACLKCCGHYRYSSNEWITKAKEIHGNKYDYSEVMYTDNKTKIIIICSEHGKFLQEPRCHLSKNGCPSCSSFRSEKLSRDIFQEYTNKLFNKIRPKFLNGLELDGYNEEIKIAFEYQGKQHEEYIPYFHRNGIEDLYKQQERDEKKLKICIEQEIKLIRIPSKYSYINEKELRHYIYFELVNIGFLKEEKY